MGIPSSLPIAEAAADKIAWNDFEQPFYGWPEGRISWMIFVTIQTVLADNPSPIARSSAASKGEESQKHQLINIGPGLSFLFFLCLF
jgi:hypothetical protein